MDIEFFAIKMAPEIILFLVLCFSNTLFFFSCIGDVKEYLKNEK